MANSISHFLPAMRRTACTHCIAYFFLFLFVPAMALAGQVSGVVRGPEGSALPGVALTLENRLTGYLKAETTLADGSYLFTNVPPNAYHLHASLDGFADAHADLELRGNLPVERSFELLPTFSEATTVTAEPSPVALERTSTSSHVDIDRSLIRRFPTAAPARALESIVLSTPGFSQDENGRYHFQGAHRGSSW